MEPKMEKIKIPVKRLPERTPEERAEYREKRELKVIEQNHQMAVAALEIEKLISAHEPADLDDPQLRMALENLPFVWQEPFRRMISKYFELREAADDNEVRFHGQIDYPADLGGDPSEIMGRWLFKKMTGEEPHGRIIFSKKEAYFILSYADKMDYALVLEGRDSRTGLVPETGAAGTYHSALLFKNKKKKNEYSSWPAPTLMIREDQDVNATVTHERQHFINHEIFDLFNEEPYRWRDRRSGYRYAIHRIKDEALAFLREGMGGPQLQESLHNPLYAYHWKGLDEDTAKKVEIAIEELKVFLEKRSTLSDGSESRALLVYQLARVSLLEFPKWLKLIERYYSRRRELAESFYDLGADDEYITNIFEYGPYFLREDFFPFGYATVARDLFKEVVEISRSVFGLRQAGLLAAYNLQFTEKEAGEVVNNLLKKYRDVTEELKRIVEPLCRDGVFVPHAKGAQLSKEEEGLVAIEFGETPSTKEMRQAVLDKVSEFPVKKIDMIIDFHNRKDSSEGLPPAHYELIELISDAVRELNDNQPCWVFFNRDSGTGDYFWFWAEVNFIAGPQDQAAGIKTVKFDIAFHGSPGEK